MFTLLGSLLAALPETAREITSVHGRAESAVIEGVLWLKLGVETVGATIIALGILSAGWLLLERFRSYCT